jgi:hypothetical protein
VTSTHASLPEMITTANVSDTQSFHACTFFLEHLCRDEHADTQRIITPSACDHHPVRCFKGFHIMTHPCADIDSGGVVSLEYTPFSDDCRNTHTPRFESSRMSVPFPCAYGMLRDTATPITACAIPSDIMHTARDPALKPSTGLSSLRRNRVRTL